MNQDDHKIVLQLTPLIGQRLASANRAADMRILHFGVMHPSNDSKIHPMSLPQPVGDIVLHIQCSWRIESKAEIITGRADLWQPIKRSSDFSYEDWDYEDGNLQDQRINQLLAENPNLVVESISVQSHGMFSLAFQGGYTLVVFPAGSDGEDWRLFMPGLSESHLVIAGGAIEPKDCQENV